MSGFDFKGDWAGRDAHLDLLNDLAEGRLPGRWGLLQQLVGHWSIPSNERGIFRYGKAALDSLGSVVSYHQKKKTVLDIDNDQCKEWLTNNDYVLAYPTAPFALHNFITAAVKTVSFKKKKIRNKLGETGDSCLFEFSIGEDKSVFFFDQLGDIKTKKKDSNTSNPFWEGPFVKEEHLDDFVSFIREIIWLQLDSTTAILSVAKEMSGEQLKINSFDPNFDFKSGFDSWNDINSIAERCKAFIDNGQSRSLLFFGPPGTGKSTMARAIAKKLDFKVLIVDHEAVDRISNVSFSHIISLISPGMIILNDIDRQDDSTASLLQSLELHCNNQYIVALTVNDISRLDPAMLRPGRINEVRKIPEPTLESRALILEYYSNKLDIAMTEKQIDLFLNESDNFSPADIKEFCETASAMGVDVALDEIKRIDEQRKLYAGANCEEFNEISIKRRTKARIQ